MAATSTDIVTRILVDNKQAITEYKNFEKQTIQSNQNIEKSSDKTQKSLHSDLQTTKKGFSQVSSVMGQAGIATGAFGGVVGGLMTVLSAGTLGVGLLVLGVSALVAIISALASSSQKSKDELKKMSDEMKTLTSLADEDAKALDGAKGRQDEYTIALKERLIAEQNLLKLKQAIAKQKLDQIEARGSKDLEEYNKKLKKENDLLDKQTIHLKRVGLLNDDGIINEEKLKKLNFENRDAQIARSFKAHKEYKQNIELAEAQRILDEINLRIEAKGIDIKERVFKKNEEIANQNNGQIDLTKMQWEIDEEIKQQALKDVEQEIELGNFLTQEYIDNEAEKTKALELRKQKELEASEAVAKGVADLGVEMFRAAQSGENFGERMKVVFDNMLQKLLEIVIQTLIFKGVMALLNLIPGVGTALSAIGSFFGNAGGQVPGYAHGGGVDTVPAMLTPGEFVINKASAMANPVSTNAINQGLNMDKIINGIGSLMQNGLSGGGQSINIGMAITSKEFTQRTIIPVMDNIGKRNIARDFRIMK